MYDQHSTEQSFERVIREIRESPVLDLRYDYLGPADKISSDPVKMYAVATDAGYVVDASLQRCYFRYRNIAVEWRGKDSDSPLVGEFDVMNIVASLDEDVQVDDLMRAESDRPLLSELFVLDDISRGGEGKLATLRFAPGMENPEIWFLDRYHDYVRLELDYCQYLENLVVTKGASGWQYLYADVSLSQHEYGYIRNNLTKMLETFPSAFPDYDYAPFRARLEERL